MEPLQLSHPRRYCSACIASTIKNFPSIKHKVWKAKKQIVYCVVSISLWRKVASLRCSRSFIAFGFGNDVICAIFHFHLSLNEISTNRRADLRSDNKKSVLIASPMLTPSLLSPFPTNATLRLKKKITWSFHVCASFFRLNQTHNSMFGVQFGVFFHPLKTANSGRIQATFVFVCVFIAIHSPLISSFSTKKSIIAILRLRGASTKKCTGNLF